MNYLAAVDDCFLDGPGGMGRVAWDIALLMRRRGHAVSMLCARRPADRGKDLPVERDGIRIVRYDRPDLPAWHPRRVERTIEAARTAASDLAASRWDLVHTHTLNTGLGALRALGEDVACLATVHSPVVPEVHVHWREQGLRGRVKILFASGKLNRLEREMLARACIVHVLSQYTQSLLQRLHGLRDRVEVVPHWRRPDLRRTTTRAEARRRLGWPAEGPVLFTIRHHGPRYGIDVAIRATAEAARRGRCVLYVGGDGPMRPRLEALARELGAADAIRFTGFLSDEDLALAYQAADLFLLPTVAMECFGLITTEALSFGLPVLSTDSGAIPETMRPILPDFIVPAGNVAALRDKILAWLDGRLVPPPAEALEAYVNERFGADAVAPRLADMLERAAAGESAGDGAPRTRSGA